MYEPLHHKYRPQTFADLVGQEAIATTLINAIASERIAPAYLFTGPRGTGKTSSARILAKSLNCQAVAHPTATPCGQCEVCRAIAKGSALDVIEIDAASNTGVDNIREIIERAQFAPVQCRYKVYVIDECHMLSVAAFNALLKTLEEPPERVIFVLATTDPQRVLPTIISRCQRFDYRRIPLDAMVAHLKKIANQETIEIADDALTLVGQMANGGLRDAESLLDQLSLLSGTITLEKVWDLVGAVPERDLLSLLQAIASNNPESVIESCRYLMNRGREPLIVLQNLASFYLNLLIAKTAPNRADLVPLTAATWQDLCIEAQQWDRETILTGQQRLKESEVQIKNTTQPRLWLEITLLSLLPSACPSPTAIESPRGQTLIETPLTPSPPSPEKRENKETQTFPEPENLIPPTDQPSEQKTQPISPPSPHPSQETDLSKIWQSVLEKLQPFAQGLVRSHCQLIQWEGKVAYIGVRTEPLLKLAQSKLEALETAFEEVCGDRVKVHLKVTSSPSTPSSVTLPPTMATPPTHNGSQKPDGELDRSINEIKDNVRGEDHKISSVNEVSNEMIASPKEHLLTEEKADLTDFSEEEIKKAAEHFAKIFDGEIIKDSEPLDDQESGVAQKVLASSQSPLPKSPKLLEEPQLENSLPNPSSSEQTQIIKGRPRISDDDEDLDF